MGARGPPVLLLPPNLNLLCSATFGPLGGRPQGGVVGTIYPRYLMREKVASGLHMPHSPQGPDRLYSQSQGVHR